MAEIKDFEAVFNMPPKDIIEYFESKGLKPSFNWYEVYNEAHSKAFTVAKMTEIDLLKDTKKLLEKSLAEGQNYSSFKKEAMELFERRGWVGYKEMKDPKTGEMKTGELATPSRVKKIYDCNMNSAYAVGRYKEQLEEIDVAPYLQYMAIMDEKTRPEHKALHKKVFRADDTFWSMFYPPNGWNCRCFVRNLTKAEVETMGLKVEKTSKKISEVEETIGDEKVKIPVYKFDNKGNIMTLKPDKGWEGNLGIKSWGIDVQAWNKVENLPEKIKYNFISKMAQNPHNEKLFENLIEEVVKNNFKTKRIEKVIQWLQPDIFFKLAKQNIELKTPIIVIQDDRIGHIVGNRAKLTVDEFKKIYNIIQKPDEIYLDYTRANENVVSLAYVKNIKNSDECYKVCTKLAQKSKISKDIVNYITTAGKVKQTDMKDTKLYKKLE